MAMATGPDPVRPAVMLRLLLVLACGLIAAPPPAQAFGLDEARRARALIGEGRWSQLLRIANPTGVSGYPAQFHAVAFELADRLWLYVPHVGTQSLSLVAGRTEADKRDLAPLLRAADPAFAQYRVIEEALVADAAGKSSSPPLPEGCFVHALADWDAMRARELVPEFAGILVYYHGAHARGHAVFYFSAQGRHYIVDRERSPEPIAIHAARTDALALAAATNDPTRRSVPRHAKLLPLFRSSHAPAAAQTAEADATE